MFFKGWEFFNSVRDFVNVVITRWFKKENPFDNFNSMMGDIQKFTEELAWVLYNGKR